MLRQRPVEAAAAHRAVGEKPDAAAAAILHHSVRERLAKERIQPVLYRGDRDDRLGRADLRHAHVGESHPAELAFAQKQGERADALLERHRGVRGVQLVQVEPLHRERPERALAGKPEVGRAGVTLPGAGRPG